MSKKVDLKDMFKSTTETTEFNGQTITMKKLSLKSVVKLQEVSADLDSTSDVARNIDALAILVSNGIEEFGQEYVQLIQEAPVEMGDALGELAQKIMKFNNLIAEDDTEGKD